jgi:hypothetical protein
MASFEQEKARVEELLRRLHLTVSTPIINPNQLGKPDTGIDCVVNLADGRSIGVQVTELDPWPTPGMRGNEKKLEKKGPYGMFAQNNSGILLEAISRAIKRKVEIATRHNFDWLDEVWLSVCVGIPESPASTLVPTGPLHPEEIELKTQEILHRAKYGYCFILPILGDDVTLYQRESGKAWEKSVGLPDVSQQPRSPYTKALLAARAADDAERFDELTEQEIKQTLHDLRTGYRAQSGKA